MSPRRASVLGGGAFGTALALALSRDGTGVALWSRDATDADEMRRTRKSGKHLPGLDLPDSLTVSREIPEAALSLTSRCATAASASSQRHA